jgi:hypothetical protein
MNLKIQPLRQKFSPEEDQKLLQLVERYGLKSWKKKSKQEQQDNTEKDIRIILIQQLITIHGVMRKLNN